MKKRNLSGIFATALIAVTIFTLASCSQDDEYYEDGLFTRADEMMTRSGEQGGGTPTPPPPTLVPVSEDSVYSSYTFAFEPDGHHAFEDSLMSFNINIQVLLYRTNGNITVEKMSYSTPFGIVYKPGLWDEADFYSNIYVNSVYFELEPPFKHRYRLCASASFSGLHSDLYPYKGVVLYRVFG